MKSKLQFTGHALKRLKERTTLTVEHAAELIDGVGVDTGAKPGLHRHHILFYSVKDDNYFVAVQDALDGTIVTVLPLEYQSNLAWSITDDQKNKAKVAALGGKPVSATKTASASHFYVGVSYLDKKGQFKAKSLLKSYPLGEQYQYDIDRFITSEITEREIEQLAVKGQITRDRMIWLSVRIGKKGDVQSFNISSGL